METEQENTGGSAFSFSSAADNLLGGAIKKTAPALSSDQQKNQLRHHTHTPALQLNQKNAQVRFCAILFVYTIQGS